MDTTVLRASDPRDLIAHLPYRLGFHPERSVVLLALRGKGRTQTGGMIARTDTIDLTEARGGRAFAASLVRHMQEDGADSLLAVFYADGTVPAARTNPTVRAALAALEEATSLVRPFTTWLVTPGGYAHLEPCECCPSAGRPAAELESSALAADLVLAGYTALPSRAHLALTRTRDAEARAEAERAAAAERARGVAARARAGGAPMVRGAAFGVPGARPARDQTPLRAWREEGARLWDTALTGRPSDRDAAPSDRPPGGRRGDRRPGHRKHHRGMSTGPATPDPATLGRLLAFLEDKVVRDAVLTSVVDSNRRSSVALLDPEAADAVFDAAPEPEHRGALDGATTLVAAVAAHAAEGAAGPPLGLLAFLAWWGLDGTRAQVYAKQALAEEPGHILAEIVVDALSHAISPPWYRR
ncbi:DUF4192 domain-containing protein [Georgenia sp. TF02-10]|uniref:DUF4192 domain-containing protein n=1 Tax=Georgenia sp. TF02-10 TaxID=2917725 RepID=UPI001FA78264|nr:DUF4192 domain-containing protein [Georgenia sp. TF02-10]UNX53400.1 DUF4192 domain-containing protein [Georgenia sp. TF02-10]